MNHMVLGGAGFIGERLVNALTDNSGEIIVIDRENPRKNLENHLNSKRIEFFKKDLSNVNLDFEFIYNRAQQFNRWTVWHLAANSDIRKGIKSPSVDYLDTLGTTISAIELSKQINAEVLVFASSSAVFGNQPGVNFNEEHEILSPESNYGNMKLASEIILRLNSEQNGIKTRVFRFPNVIGWPTTHGVIHDFVANIQNDQTELKVLGNGHQTKPYIHVDDLVEIMMRLCSTEKHFDIYNIGPDDRGISVRQIAEAVVSALSPNTKILYQRSPIGWIGDVPSYTFDTTKLKNSLPEVRLSSEHALFRTLGEM